MATTFPTIDEAIVRTPLGSLPNGVKIGYLTHSATWGSETIANVPLLSKLSTNWDGEGGRVPSQLVIDEACRFLGILQSEINQNTTPLDEPFVTATHEGGVLLHWHLLDECQLEVEFVEKNHGVDWTYSMFNSKTHDSLEGRVLTNRMITAIPFPLSMIFASQRMVASESAFSLAQ